MVDCHNFLALGPDGMHRTIRVNTWHRRLFMGLLSISVVNGLLAYNKCTIDKGGSAVTLSQFKYDLSEAILVATSEARGRGARKRSKDSALGSETDLAAAATRSAIGTRPSLYNAVACSHLMATS